jgi:DNA-binding NarL/FixJ family response regulator
MTTAKILIADDNEGIRKSLKALLSGREGWTLCGEATNGLEAVALADKSKPDLIVLDVAMPIMDGFHAAAEIVKKMPDVPIVLYTLHKSEQIELEGKKTGARRLISKLDDTQVLLDCIEELLNDRHSSAVPLSTEPAALPATEPQSSAAPAVATIPDVELKASAASASAVSADSAESAQPKSEDART